MTPGFRSLRRLRHSPFFIAALVLFLTSGAIVGGTFASFTAETQNSTSAYATGWLGAATSPLATPSGYDGSLTWTPATHGLNGQTLYSEDNGSSSTCPATGYSSTAMASSSTASYTDSHHNSTTLAAAITTTTATSISVSSDTGFGTSTPFTIEVDNEQMTVTSVGLTPFTTWTVTRGANSTTAATHTSGALVWKLPDPFDGHYFCYQMVSTLSGSSWNASATLPAAQLGLVAQSIAFANGASSTSGKIDAGDKITIVFNQAPTGITTGTRDVCIAPGGTNGSANVIILGDTAGTPCTATTDANDTGAISGFSFSSSAANPIENCNSSTFSISSSTLTITLGTSGGMGATGQCVQATASADTYSGTGTYAPAATIKSSATTDQAPVCTSATYSCKPTPTGSF